MQKETGVNKILQELRKGKIAAYEKLFKLYHPRLFSYANRFLEDSFEAEDLIQEAFIEIWKRKDLFTSEKQFTSYLFSMVKNRCLNAIKRKIIEEKYVVSQINSKTEELYDLSFGMEDDFISMEKKIVQMIEDVILEMPERCGEAFRLKWIEGKKLKEIAQIMNISATMVDKHLAKGLEIARKKIKPSLLLFITCIKN